ncbi:MAG: TonB family protein [Acidobacteria bacterium]|nr:TonB family protein [Acidobacteriota bacterium]
MLFAASLVTHAAGSPVEDADALSRRGKELLDAGKVAEAVEVLQSADAEAEGRSAEALRLLADALERSGDQTAASEALLRLFRLQPQKEGETLRRLVRSYQEQGREDRIPPVLREYLKAQPAEVEVAWASNEMGYWLVDRAGAKGEKISGGAYRAFLRALELSGGRSDVASLNLAETFWRQGHHDEAREIVRESSMGAQEGGAQFRSLPLSDELAEIWRQRASRPEPSATEAADTEPTTTEPAAIYSPAPEYTEIARKARVQGDVILRVEVDPTGRPKVLGVVKDLPMGLREAAIEAVERWRFQPARNEEGRPVAAETEITVQFSLQ